MSEPVRSFVLRLDRRMDAVLTVHIRLVG
jgi:hypothetical protein